MRHWLRWVVIALVLIIAIPTAAYVTLFASRQEGTRIGAVSTTFRFFGPNDKVALDRFDDDAVGGVSCYLARARTGGIGGAVGTAEDPSRLSLSCVKVAALKPAAQQSLVKLSGKRVFSERASILFKTIDVRRFYDPERHTLCYVAISTKIINGSPMNATSCIDIAEPK